MRAKLAGAVVVMGSATPSLESWQNAERGKYTRIELRDRVMNRPLPEVEIVDMRQRVQADEQGPALFAFACRANQGGARTRRAGADSAQPARLFVCRDVPLVRRKTRMPELRHCAHASQSRSSKTARSARRATAGVPLLRLQTDGAGAVSQVRQRTSVLPGRGLAAGRRAARGDLSLCTYRAHGSGHGARALRSGTSAGASALGRDQSAGGDADDCQGPRHSQRHAGGRGGLRSRAFHAGFSRGRARLSTDDAGERARGARRVCRAAWWCRRIIPITTRF